MKMIFLYTLVLYFTLSSCFAQNPPPTLANTPELENLELKEAISANQIFLKLPISQATLEEWENQKEKKQSNSFQEILSAFKKQKLSLGEWILLYDHPMINAEDQELILGLFLERIDPTQSQMVMENLESVLLWIIALEHYLHAEHFSLAHKQEWLFSRRTSIIYLFDLIRQNTLFFGVKPIAQHLISTVENSQNFFPGAQWLKAGDKSYSINVLLMPNALKAMLKLYLSSQWQGEFKIDTEQVGRLKNSLTAFTDRAHQFFELKLNYLNSRNKVRKAAACWNFDYKYSASEINEDIAFYALALRPKAAYFEQVNILHPMPLMQLKFGDIEEIYAKHAFLKDHILLITKLFPAGLLTASGVLSSSPTYDDQNTLFYHGCENIDPKALLELENSLQSPPYLSFSSHLSPYFNHVDLWYELWMMEGILPFKERYQKSSIYVKLQDTFIYEDLLFFLHHSIQYQRFLHAPYSVSLRPINGWALEDQPSQPQWIVPKLNYFNDLRIEKQKALPIFYLKWKKQIRNQSPK